MKKLSELIVGDTVKIQTNTFYIASGKSASVNVKVEKIADNIVYTEHGRKYCHITGKTLDDLKLFNGYKDFIAAKDEGYDTTHFLLLENEDKFNKAIELEHNAISIDESRKVLFFESECDLSMFKFLLELNSN